MASDVDNRIQRATRHKVWNMSDPDQAYAHEVLRARRALELQGAGDELRDVQLAGVVPVQDLEELGRFVRPGREDKSENFKKTNTTKDNA